MRRAAFAICLAGCGGADATSLPQPAVGALPAPSPASTELGLVSGETMAFEVRLSGVLAGEAQLAVGQLGEVDGHRALVVTSRAATAGAAALFKSITDESTTVIDAETGRPLKLDTSVVVDGTTTTAHAVFTGTSANVTYSKTGDDKEHAYRVNFGGVTAYDAHSAMAQLRGWRGAPGATRTVYVVGGKRLWRVDVHFIGIESIGSALGNRRAVHLDGAAFHAKANGTLESDKPTRTFSVWLSDDADRVPLKLVAKTELGEVAMAITDYNRP
jgi:uncharacterized protein DUF3108